MNRYAKCIENRVYFKGDWGENYHPDLIIGKVYRVASPLPQDASFLIRIYDGSYGDAGSESGYLYPRDYFEPVELHTRNSNELARKAVAVHLPESIAGVLHAEAIMAEKSVSALLREWVEERLDLPEIDASFTNSP